MSNTKTKAMLLTLFTAGAVVILGWANLHAAPVPPDLKCNPHTCWQLTPYKGYIHWSDPPSMWEFGFLTAGNPNATFTPQTMPFGTDEDGTNDTFYDSPNDSLTKTNKLVKDGTNEIAIKKWTSVTTRCSDPKNAAIKRTPALEFTTAYDPRQDPNDPGPDYWTEPFPKFKCVNR